MRIVAPDAMCASISEPRAPLGCVFRHDATRFACTACAGDFRSVRELAVHRRRAHRSLAFQDWYESSCACRALFTARLDAFVHSSRCDHNANQSANAVPSSAASTTRADADATAPPPAISLPRSGFPRPCPSCAALLLDAATWTTHVHACAAATSSHPFDNDNDNDNDDDPLLDDVLMDYDDSEFFDAICIPDEDADVLDDGDEGDEGGNDDESSEPLPLAITNAPSAPLHATMLCGTVTQPWLLRFDGAFRHIDRALNRQADRLANQALDLLKTVSVCALSQTRVQDDTGAAHGCWHWTPPDASPTDDASTSILTQDVPVPMDIDDYDPDEPMNAADDPVSINAEREGGTVYPVLRLGPNVVPDDKEVANPVAPAA
uniref:C2H2-type domain-containing protein n=1 Tax=Globisporangium ultimum (strain ATCC 200006 / CBS 805.95 / DAOM BR144) TaxID=431595 RepID=K3XCN4_GLOUD